jgi:hypothetical protein
MAVTSYFAAARGMARRGAIKHLVNTLTLARQRACMDNARVSVVLYNQVSGIVDADLGGTEKAVIPSYVVCKEVGKVTMFSSPHIIDEFNALDTVFSTDSTRSDGFKLYNLTEGGISYVYSYVENMAKASKINGRDSPYKHRDSNDEEKINAWAFKINSSVSTFTVNWNVGDSYGIEAAPVQTLPRSFEIQSLGSDYKKIVVITFLPDGRALASKTITVAETRKPLLSSSITVSDKGKISYNGKWN